MPNLKIENADVFRANIRSKLNVILQNEKNTDNLEKGIFNYTLKEAANRKVVKKWDNPYFTQLYVDHLRSIYMNLKNKDLIDMLNTSKIKPHEIAFMTHQEMRPDIWKELIELKQKKDMLKFENNMEASTDTFTCRKCKSKKCTYYMLQTRSSDEPMSVFISCIDCGARFKTS